MELYINDRSFFLVVVRNSLHYNLTVTTGQNAGTLLNGQIIPDELYRYLTVEMQIVPARNAYQWYTTVTRLKAALTEPGAHRIKFYGSGEKMYNDWIYRHPNATAKITGGDPNGHVFKAPDGLLYPMHTPLNIEVRYLSPVKELQ